MGRGRESGFFLEYLRDCLGRSLQQIFWVSDVRAGLFLAKALLSTAGLQQGHGHRDFPEQEKQAGDARLARRSHGAGHLFPGASTSLSVGCTRNMPRDQAPLIPRAHSAGGGLNLQCSPVLFFVVGFFVQWLDVLGRMQGHRNQVWCAFQDPLPAPPGLTPVGSLLHALPSPAPSSATYCP